MQPIWHSTKPLLLVCIGIFLVLLLSRLALVLWQWNRVISADMLRPVFIQGARFDLVLIGMFMVIPMLLYPILGTSSILLPLWKTLLMVVVPAILLLVVLMEFSTPSFADQFDARPNVLFFEYFEHPAEVIATLWGAYRLPLIAGNLLLLIIAWLTISSLWSYLPNIQPAPFLPSLLAGAVLAIGSGILARSTFDHRPVNPSTVALSEDALVNDLALNSSYTMLYAAYEMRNESKGGFRYGTMNAQTAIDVVKRNMNVDVEDFTSSINPTLHTFHATRAARPRKNLVIILEESLGAEFVGALGGKDLTPNLDSLKSQGLWFEQLYATGTRSVRGIEAVITGFPPTPARSVVKLSKSQRHFYTLADQLGKEGYTTSFIYGGEAQFDNMRRFFMNNGFQSVIDHNNYKNPIFDGSWGVSDEDLFNRAHEEFSGMGDQPFFSLVFTSSNHTPFDFPDGRITLFDKDNKQTVNNAVKYADHALGQFVEKAKQSDYWNNTVFLIVADHNSRVVGAELVPIKRFHIPGVIIGGSIDPDQYTKVASQIDLPPTLLSLIGISGEHPMIGHDLTKVTSDHIGRAIMQFNAIQAYMQEDRVVIMQRDIPPAYYYYNNGELKESKAPFPELSTSALAHSTWASDTYERARYSAAP